MTAIILEESRWFRKSSLFYRSCVLKGLPARAFCGRPRSCPHSAAYAVLHRGRPHDKMTDNIIPVQVISCHVVHFCNYHNSLLGMIIGIATLFNDSASKLSCGWATVSRRASQTCLALWPFQSFKFWLSENVNLHSCNLTRENLKLRYGEDLEHHSTTAREPAMPSVADQSIRDFWDCVLRTRNSPRAHRRADSRRVWLLEGRERGK